eukprot:5663862-Pyramimonas_sp.AAC.1
MGIFATGLRWPGGRFVGRSALFSFKSVSPRAKFQRFQQRVQSAMSYGLDCCTLDAERLRVLHGGEG